MTKPKPKHSTRPRRTSKPKPKPKKKASKPKKPTVGEMRRGMGFTQIELADLIGVHPITVSRWERGVLSPHPWQSKLIETLAEPGYLSSIDRINRAWHRAKGESPIRSLYLLLMRNFDPELYRSKIDNDKS